jgi:hypothetical protein
MAQVTLYLDEETTEKVRQAAQSAGLSMSRWVADAIRSRIDSEWPANVRELAGAWPDLPTAEDLRTPAPADAMRERL